MQRVSEPRYDFVLRIEGIDDRLLEALGPKVLAVFGIDQLNVHPKPIAVVLH